MSDLEARLVGIFRADPRLMHVLTTLRPLGLPDWRVFSGAVCQSVWNHLTDRSAGYGVRDYDLGYFDPDTSWNAEDVIIKRVAAAFEPPFRDIVEVRNQTRCRSGLPPISASRMTRSAVRTRLWSGSVTPAFAVGVRLQADDTISVAAPLGLQDMFNLTLRPNPNRGLAKDWGRVVERAVARWPELKVTMS